MQKLQLGVVPSTEARRVVSLKKVRSGPKRVSISGSFVDAIIKDLSNRKCYRIQLRENEVHRIEKLLRQCLVEWFWEVLTHL